MLSPTTTIMTMVVIATTIMAMATGSGGLRLGLKTM